MTHPPQNWDFMVLFTCWRRKHLSALLCCGTYRKSWTWSEGTDPILERSKTQVRAAATPVPVPHPSPAPTRQLQPKSSSAGAVCAASGPFALKLGRERSNNRLCNNWCSSFLYRHNPKQNQGNTETPFAGSCWIAFGVWNLRGLLAHVIIQA